MSTQLDPVPAVPELPVLDDDPGGELSAWTELDITIVESGPTADRLIQMTDDGCGQTCQSACSTTCP